MSKMLEILNIGLIKYYILFRFYFTQSCGSTKCQWNETFCRFNISKIPFQVINFKTLRDHPKSVSRVESSIVYLDFEGFFKPHSIELLS